MKELESLEEKPQIQQINIDFKKLEIGGLQEELDKIVTSVLSRTISKEQMEKLGQKNHNKGILLYGPPGTGKTLISKTICKILNVPPERFTAITSTEVLDKYIGESEGNIRRLFQPARYDPSHLYIVFIDEFDSIGTSRGGGGDVGSRNSNNIGNQLLSEMDGAKALDNVIVIAATNRRDLIDSALLREGRFGLQIYIGLPNQAQREAIFKVYLAQNLQEGKIDILKLATLTPNYSGAKIAGVCNKARGLALKKAITFNEKNEIQVNEKKLVVTQKDLETSIKEIHPVSGSNPEAVNEILPKRNLDLSSQSKSVEEIYEKMLQCPPGKVYNFSIIGDENSGKTAIAGKIADKALKDFDNVQIIYNQTQGLPFDYKIKKAFEDASPAKRSLIILDELDALLGMLSVRAYNEGNILLMQRIIKSPIKNTIIFLSTQTPRCEEILEDVAPNLKWTFSTCVLPLSKQDCQMIVEYCRNLKIDEFEKSSLERFLDIAQKEEERFSTSKLNWKMNEKDMEM